MGGLDQSVRCIMQTGAHLLLCLILHYVEAAEASQCWQGATYSEAVVSPALRSSNILRVPDVSSLAQCAGACCDLPGCNLAWLFEHRCYILSCQQRENCHPRQRPGADSYMAFLQRGPPQTLLLQSLVRGEPYPSRWRPRSSGDVESSDDRVIISHHWEQVGGPSIELGAFSDTQILNLSNLAPGEYTFRLTITDSAGLSDSSMATVKVIQSVENDQMPYPSHVTLTSSPGLAATLAHRQDDPTAATPSASASVTQKTENKSTPIAEVKVSNGAPVAIVGPNRQLTLPVTSVTLDGSSSTDDHAVTSYHWDTIRGPPGSRTQGVDKPIAIVTSLRAGRYTFSLTVSDQEGLKDSALLTVRVQEARSLPPVAHASGSHTRALPNNSLVLRGSVTDGDPATVDFLCPGQSEPCCWGE
nr:dyslexia-associated protein KIAA0319-like [Oncorhynchus nerka]